MSKIFKILSLFSLILVLVFGVFALIQPVFFVKVFPYFTLAAVCSLSFYTTSVVLDNATFNFVFKFLIAIITLVPILLHVYNFIDATFLENQKDIFFATIVFNCLLTLSVLLNLFSKNTNSLLKYSFLILSLLSVTIMCYGFTQVVVYQVLLALLSVLSLLAIVSVFIKQKMID